MCGSEDLRLFYTQGNRDEFRFYRCRRCRLVNYDLSTGLNQEKYAVAAPDPRDDGAAANRGPTKTFDFIRRRLPCRGKLLDIGCGNGRLLWLARRAGFEVAGLELSSSLADRVRRELGVDVIAADFLSMADEPASCCDVVVLRHVLEHLPDPLAAMGRIRARLAPSGHAVLEFPNIEGWDLALKRILRRAGLHRKRYPANYQPGHCNEYGRASFRFLLQKTGFELVRWETYSLNAAQNLLFSVLPVANKARALIRRA